jgi:argonaute-like protein implicated in RNA metabolism and viral defense
VAVSFFHHYKNIDGYTGTKEELFDAILDDKVLYGPILQHIREFWSIRNEPYILFLTYEEMKMDLGAVLKKVSRFFGKSYTDDALRGLEKHLSVDEMRKNPAANYEEFVKEIGVGVPFKFIRKGVIGSHKSEMSAEYVKKFDDWIERGMQGCDLKFL